MIDLLGNEYGWSAECILAMPIDQPPQLIHAMLHRRRVKVYRKNPEKEENTPSLSERMKAIFAPVDTAD